MADHDTHDHTGVPGVGTGTLSDNGVITYLDATEGAAPATPASGKVRIYAKADGRIYSKDDAGTEYGPFDAAGGAGGGSGYSTTIAAETGLVAYWPLNETRGSTSFADTVGGTALAAPSGAVYATGASLTKDTDGGSAAIGTSWLRRSTIANIFKNANSWSIEFWMVGTMTSIFDSGIVGMWNGSAGPQIFYGGLADFRIYYGGSNKTTTITAAQWTGLHHWVLTWDTSALKLYLDGTDLSLTSMPTGTNTDSGVNFEVGRYNNGSGSAQGFVVSDVAIYSVALSSTKVSDHYALGTGA